MSTTRVLVLLVSFALLVTSLDNFLAQAKRDTFLVLRDIIRNSQRTTSSTSRDIRVRRSYEQTMRNRRDIANAVIESGHCEHVDLIDCSDFETDSMTCMLTATGMTCCVCTGMLRAAKWKLF